MGRKCQLSSLLGFKNGFSLSWLKVWLVIRPLVEEEVWEIRLDSLPDREALVHVGTIIIVEEESPHADHPASLSSEVDLNGNHPVVEVPGATVTKT